MARTFKKNWESAYDKAQYQDSTITNYADHGQNDPNSSHYLKSETYSRDEANATFEPIISGIGTTADYYRGDRTWADFGTKARKYFSASYPLTYTEGTGNFTLSYNTTNLQLTTNQLNTIQNITTTSTPQFAKIGLGKTPTAVLDITSSGTSANEGLALTNTNSTYTWKMWMGTPGNYDAYLKFGLDPTTQNDFLVHLYKNNGGCLSASERLVAPYHCAPMTGYGDYNLIGWTNTGGSFNGYAFISADTGNTGSGAADVRIIMGLNSSSKISFLSGTTEWASLTQAGAFTAKGTLTVDSTATIKGDLIQQPPASSSITLTSGSALRASSTLYLDTALTGGNIVFRPKLTTIATMSDRGVGIGTATISELLNVNGHIKHSGNSSIYNSFASGWTGTGWRLDYGVTNTNTGTLELDDLWVRGTMSVYELLINQIRATNGSLFVTSSARVKDYDSGDPEQITFEDITGHGVTPFAVDDLIMCQRVSLDALTVIKRVVREIVTLSGLTAEVQPTTGGPSDTGTILPGDDFVRIGNLGDYPNRQGTIYLTADDSNAPYIDIIDDVASWADWTDISKNKGRIGRLNGISESPFGSLTGYGIYSQNAFMTGNVNVWGTLTAGDYQGFEPNFYAGKIQKNLFKKSENALAGDTGYALWVWNGGSSYTNENISSLLPGGGSGYTTHIRRSSASGSISMVIDGQNSRTWIGDQGEFDGKIWTVSFWLYAGGTDTDGDYVFTLDFPDGTQIDTKTITLVVGEWQRVSFTFDLTGLTGGYIKLAAPLKYSATHKLVFYGFQIEEGSIATPYQQTDGNTTTPISGYGMWAKKGGFGGTLQNPRTAIVENGIIVRSADTASASWLGSSTISIGYSTNEWGIIGKYGADKYFELGSTNQIAGWVFNNTKLYKDDVRLEASASFSGFAVDVDSTDIVKIGDFTYSSLTSSMSDITVSGIGYSGVNSSDPDWEFRGSWDDNKNVQQDPDTGFATDGIYTYVWIAPYDVAHNWDYTLYHSIDDIYLFMGREIKLDFLLKFSPGYDYRDTGGDHKTYIRYYNGSTLIYQINLFEQTVPDGLTTNTYDKTGSNGYTVKLPYMDNITDVQICWNFYGGDQSGTDYGVKEMWVEQLKIYGYVGYKTYISKNGFEVYNSPYHNIKFAGNKYEINASSLKINNLLPVRNHGRISSAPTENIQVGDIYINSGTDAVYICYKMDTYGVPTWKTI